MKKAILLITLLLAALLLGSCAGMPGEVQQPTEAPQATPAATPVATSLATALASPMVTDQDVPVAEYRRIAPEKVKEMMDHGGGFTLLDVRTQEEFNAGYIPGAILIPDFELAARAAAELPQKDAVILVYCRSGRRSAASTQALVDMGYTRVYDLGGINSWPYETATP